MIVSQSLRPSVTIEHFTSPHFSLLTDGPVIQQEQTNIKTVAGEEIHITCTVEAEPAPSLTWERDGVELSERSHGVVINQAGKRYNLIILGNTSLSRHHHWITPVYL